MDIFMMVIYLCVAIPLVGSKTAYNYMEALLKDHASIKADPPSRFSKQPTEVKIGIYVNSISGVKDGQNMQQSLNLYLRHSWKDERLIFQPSDYNENSNILLPDEAWKKIWVPDLFIRNEENAVMHGTARENVLLKVNSSGFAWFVIKATTRTSCPMKLQKYPFDTQTCPIMFESFRYTMDIMYMSWLDKAVEIDASSTLSGFNLQDTLKYDCSQNYTAGSFPCLEINFVIQRNIGHFVLQMFIPTMLLVILSWFTFWMDPMQFAQRVQIILVLVVVLIAQYEFYGKDVVDVSYVKAFDIWMYICLISVFAVLLESTVVNVVGSKAQPNSNNANLTDRPDQCGRTDNSSKAKRIDISSRVLFPVSFAMVTILYFAICALA